MSEALDKAIEYLQQSHSPAEVQEILRQKLTAITSSDFTQPRSSSTTNPSTLKTSPLKTVTVVPNPIRPPKDFCLSNLYQIEQDHAPLSNGYSVIHIGSSYSDVGGCEIFRGDVQQQRYQCEENLVYVQEAGGAPRRLFDDQAPFTMPSLDGILSNYASSDLERVMEDELAGCSDLQTSQDYLIAAAHTTESRKQLGLPESPLEAGTRLLSTLKHYPGIHSAYAYVSKNRTKFALHVEDFYLKSANLLHAGAPKLWVIINPQCMHKFEGCVAELLNIQSRCSQFLRHSMLLLPPSILHFWGIQFSVVIQQLGDLILIDSNAYHYGANLGPNIAEAINYSDPDWRVPPTYTDCAKNKGCGDTQHMMRDKMKMGTTRALDIKDFHDIGLKTNLKQHSSSQAPTSKQTNMVLRSRSSCASAKQYPKSTSTSRHITTRSAQPLKPNAKGKAEKDEKQNGWKGKDGEMAIDEGGEGEKNQKTEVEKDKKKGEKIEAKKGKKMEAEKGEKDKEGGGEMIEAEKGEGESEKNKKIEMEKDKKSTKKNEKGESEENKENEESKAKNDKNGEAKENKEGETEENGRGETKTDQTGDAEEDDDGVRSSCVDLEEIESILVSKTLKEKSRESIESAELCKVFDLTLTENDDEDEEEEGGEDHLDTDEKSPAYEAGDSVGEIQWWIQYAILHHKQSTWSSFPSTTQSTEQLQHDLSCFDPTKQPVQKTWLNDRVILYLLKSLLLFNSKTQILDPIILTQALKEKNTRFLRLDADMTHLIAPYHQNDHWCLFIINLSDRKLEIYDTTEETNPAVQFLEQALSPIHRWTVTHKPLFPAVSDQSNCGVFTIAHSEAFLSSGRLPSTCPTELRLRYIRRLVKPLYHELESARHLGHNQRKRKGSFPQVSTAEHQTKRVKHLPFALGIPVAESDCALNEVTIAEKISRFSAEWAQFYRDQLASQGITPNDMHHILALVSAVGCPQVMADLTDMLQDTEAPPPSNNPIQAALNLYTNAEKSLLRSKIWMRYASDYMYLAFEEIKKSTQSRQKSLKQARRTAARQDKKIAKSEASGGGIPALTKRGASYALEQLAADALEVSVEELAQHQRRNAYKERIRKIKDEGKAAHRFNEICNQRLWILVPAQDMASPLDNSMIVKSNMYLQLSNDHLRLFAHALQELRPKLHHLINRAAHLDDILREPFNGHRMTYRLEVLGAEAILKEELDSHDLLHCLDEVPSSV